MTKKTYELSDKCIDLVKNAEKRKPLGSGSKISEFKENLTEIRGEQVYSNKNERLEIDFFVKRLNFPGIQTMDPRIVTISPGKTNERHRHAHESLFVIIKGDAEVLIGENTVSAKSGDILFVPRWEIHRTRNTSKTNELVVLAITDFGFTSAVLGDYDKRTRLSNNGDDSLDK